MPGPQGYSTGNTGGSNYVPPPPPPPPNPSSNSSEAGFGDPAHTRKLWRNAAIGLAITTVLVLFGIWLLGRIAERLVGFVPPEVDVALGEQNWEQLAPPEHRCQDPGPLAYVEEISQPLVDAADSEFEFQFVVVDSEDINAFALPGGFVAVNMGLLEAAETGEEVAAVIGHELTHVTARHGTRRVLRQIGGFAAVAMIFGGTDFETIAFAAEGLAQQAYSRDQERESDDGGRQLLMAAGIDPIGMATFFERLEEMYASMPEGMRSSMALVSTHPDPGERAETTREIAADFVATRDLPDPPQDLRCNSAAGGGEASPEPSE